MLYQRVAKRRVEITSGGRSVNKDMTFCTSRTCLVRKDCQRWQDNYVLNGWISLCDFSEGKEVDGCEYYLQKYKEEIARAKPI